MRKTTCTLLIVLLAFGFVAATSDVEDSDAVNTLTREISRMESDVSLEQSRHQAHWNEQQQECNSELAFRAQEVADAANAYDAATSAEGKCVVGLAAATSDKSRAERYVSAINTILDNLLTQRNQEHQRFETVVHDQLDPAIEAVKGVFPIINEEVESQNQNAGAPSALLQTQINKSFIQLVKANRAIQFTAVFAQLLATKEVGVSQEVVDQAIALFNDLLADLEAEKAQLIEVENQAVIAYNANVQQYSDILLTLDTTIQSLEVYIQQMTTCVEDESAVADQAEAKRNRNQQALDFAIDLCQAQEDDFRSSTDARNEELALFQKLKKFVRDQADLFGTYGVDTVDVIEQYKKQFAQTKSIERNNFLQLSLKQFQAAKKPQQKVASKCETCRKSFLQKKVGF